MSKRTSNAYFHGLDLVRIVAASLVVMHHYALFGWIGVGTDVAEHGVAFPFLAPMANTGAVGVQIFFVISGFVIAMSMSLTRPVEFLTKRALRILPALWICGLIALAARVANGEDFTTMVAAYLRSSVLSPIGPYIDGVVWTLVVEAVFYCLVFACMVAVPALPRKRIAVYLGVGSAIYLAIFGLAAYFRYRPEGQFAYEILERFPFKVLLLRHGVFFALGILLYVKLVEKESGVSPVLLGILAGFGILEVVITMDETNTSIALGVIFWLIGMAAVLASIRFAGQLARPLSGKRGIVRNLGLLSYPLYLNHYTFGMVLVPSLFALGLGQGWVLLLSLSIILATSWLVTIGPEPAVRGMLRQALSRTMVAAGAGNR